MHALQQRLDVVGLDRHEVDVGRRSGLLGTHRTHPRPLAELGGLLGPPDHHEDLRCVLVAGSKKSVEDGATHAPDAVQGHDSTLLDHTPQRSGVSPDR